MAQFFLVMANGLEKSESALISLLPTHAPGEIGDL